LKIYINRKPVSGPWGGGNKFVRILSEYLHSLKYDVTYELTPDVDIIFCFDPRPNSGGLWYQDFINHKLRHNSKIIQRVGDIGTHSKPDLTHLVKASTEISDFVIFPSRWAKDTIGYEKKNYQIIENGPLPIFYSHKKTNHTIGDKLKVVTHHWSTNAKKGYDYYEQLGKQIKANKLQNVEFTFIGRYNHKYSSAGINLIESMDEKQLSIELPKHDVYLTASLEEAGANHVLEAMACGLPIVYRSGGGSINEYCKGHGIEYDCVDSLIHVIRNINENLNNHSIQQYSLTILDTVKEYEKIIVGNLT
jgi:hypothetical protein